jgi:hypothetical protein
MSAARRILTSLAVAFAALASAGPALATGGNYVFDGGTAREQAQVHAALDASAFDWGVVPGPVTIHFVRGVDAEAAPGEIWIDPQLVDSGRFAWGIVQHEYAHQVDFFLFDNAIRTRLAQLLGASAWCWDVPGFDHAQYGCERFASTLAWAYWPSRFNALRPSSPDAESAAMPPAKFRALIGRLLADGTS